MARPRQARGKQRRWSRGLVYHYQKDLRLSSIGNLITGSKAKLRAVATGSEPIGVGAPGDALLGADAVADFLNEIYGINVTAGADAALREHFSPESAATPQ